MGRRPQPGKDQSQEVQELAEWLWAQLKAAGMSLRDLEEKNPIFKRTTVSEKLRKAQVPDLHWVEAFVKAVSGADAHGREVLLNRARLLWEAANDATSFESEGRAVHAVSAEQRSEAAAPSRAARVSLRSLIVAGALVVIGGGALTAMIWPESSTSTTAPALPSLTGSPSSMKTPVPSAPSIGPLIPGDSSSFPPDGDVTIPDGTTVHVGEKFVKTWKIHNNGSVRWHNRFLSRQGILDAPGLCTSVAQVAVPDTDPGDYAVISVTFTAPSLPGSCRVDWKMTDAEGHKYFPSPKHSGVYVIVNVAGAA